MAIVTFTLTDCGPDRVEFSCEVDGPGLSRAAYGAYLVSEIFKSEILFEIMAGLVERVGEMRNEEDKPDDQEFH